MSKYDALWQYVRERGGDELVLSFAEVQEIAGVAIDHSFLRYKKELTAYGYQVGKISLKNETVAFKRI